jgi:hypothetical protein
MDTIADKMPKEIEERAASWYRAMSCAWTHNEWDWAAASPEIKNIWRINALLEEYRLYKSHLKYSDQLRTENERLRETPCVAPTFANGKT